MTDFEKWLKKEKGINTTMYYGVLSSADQKELYDEFKDEQRKKGE